MDFWRLDSNRVCWEVRDELFGNFCMNSPSPPPYKQAWMLKMTRSELSMTASETLRRDRGDPVQGYFRFIALHLLERLLGYNTFE